MTKYLYSLCCFYTWFILINNIWIYLQLLNAENWENIKHLRGEKPLQSIALQIMSMCLLSINSMYILHSRNNTLFYNPNVSINVMTIEYEKHFSYYWLLY